MEYWEFLLQKEGDRSWQPIKSPRIEIEAARYRVVAHSNRANTDVEICVTHESTEEVPPRRRSQKRSRRTNPEGLMVVIPFTYLKPGLWELRCCGDIMSDFLGKSWNQVVQLSVLPKPTEVMLGSELGSPVVDTPQRDVQTALAEDLPDCFQPNLAIEPAPAETDATSVIAGVVAVEVPSAQDLGEIAQPRCLSSSDSPIPSPDFDVAEALSAPTWAEAVIPWKPVESDLPPVVLTDDAAEVAAPKNPIWEQSLQMLEEILQQVLEPVLQEFDSSESPDPETSKTPNSEASLETEAQPTGLILTLDAEGLLARRGESLVISGQVDVWDVNQISSGTSTKELQDLFQGRLRYELRDPQTSQVLLDSQQPLPEQSLPLSFSHTLEIPADCKTRLILGKVTLYGSTSAALASQSFSVTADLDELLGAIIPGSQVMPVAKIMVLANKLANFPDHGKEPLESVPPLNQALLDLVDSPQSHQPLSLKPVSPKPLPPQLYQPGTTSRRSKSIQLPKFPQRQPVATSAESSVAMMAPELVEVQGEDSVGGDLTGKQAPGDLGILEKNSQHQPQPAQDNYTLGDQPVADLAEDARPESLLPDQVVLGVDEVTDRDVLVSTGEGNELSDSSVAIANSSSRSNQPQGGKLTIESGADDIWFSDSLETPEHSAPTTDSQLDTELCDREPTLLSDETEQANIPTSAFVNQLSDSAATEPESPLTEVPVADEPTEVDQAFLALKLQDRFWWRLNSLAADAELSEWLKSELSPSINLAEVEEVTPSLDYVQVFPEVEEVTPSLDYVQVFPEVEEVTPSLDYVQVFPEVEEVTQPLNSDALMTDFDESIWEEADNFGELPAEIAQLQQFSSQESNAPDGEMSVTPPRVAVIEKDWTAQEIVVDDEDLLAPENPVVHHDASGMVYPTVLLGSQPRSSLRDPRQLDSLLPAPTLLIPANELASGEPVTVRLKLPPHPARLCVKLWVQDRQSRSLLDGPRWLVDLLPDGAGKLEAMTQLTVPFGSVEIRFEAIAVDLDSQRESHKVVVDCVVVPPDLPSFSLDEFEP